MLEYSELFAPVCDTQQIFARRLFKVVVSILRAPAEIKIFAFGSFNLELFQKNLLSARLGRYRLVLLTDVQTSTQLSYLDSLDRVEVIRALLCRCSR